MNNIINKNINKNKRRNVWFESTFCKLSNINLGEKFSGLINQYFKKDKILSKMINTNNVKISYSCFNNISKIIYCHNKKITRRTRLE